MKLLVLCNTFNYRRKYQSNIGGIFSRKFVVSVKRVKDKMAYVV